MKRILHVVGSMNRAGAESMVMNLYRTIDKSQYQFDFVYFTENQCDFDKEIINLGGKIYRFPDKYSNNTIVRTYKLYQLIKNKKPFHAIHCHQLLSNAFHLLAAFFAGITIRISHAHSTKDIKNTNLLRNFYNKGSKIMISLLTTKFIACGKQAGNFLFPFNKNIVFIPNAVNIKKFINTKELKTNNYFNISSIKKDTLIFSQIGRLMPVKNIDFTIHFVEYLKNKNIDFHFFHNW